MKASKKRVNESIVQHQQCGKCIYTHTRTNVTLILPFIRCLLRSPFVTLARDVNISTARVFTFATQKRTHRVRGKRDKICDRARAIHIERES